MPLGQPEQDADREDHPHDEQQDRAGAKERTARLDPSQLESTYVKGPGGQLVPLSTFAKLEKRTEPRSLNRFQQLNAVKLSGVAIRPLDQALRFLEDEAAKIMAKHMAVPEQPDVLERQVEATMVSTNAPQGKPLSEVTAANVKDLKLAWVWNMNEGGANQAMPLVHNGTMYLWNTGNIIQALDAKTGELIWEHEVGPLESIGFGSMRNIAIYGDKIIDLSVNDYVYAIDARTGEPAWETRINDYRELPGIQGSGPIIAKGKIFSGRACDYRYSGNACVITAHDARTGKQVRSLRLDDIAAATRHLVESDADSGVYHCVNSGHATWHDVAVETARRLGVQPRLVPITLAGVKLKADRPVYCALDNQKLARAGFAMPAWQDAVARWLAGRAQGKVGK